MNAELNEQQAEWLAKQVTKKAECTNSDKWNCKYCAKNKSCDALNDPRNFGVPK